LLDRGRRRRHRVIALSIAAGLGVLVLVGTAVAEPVVVSTEASPERPCKERLDRKGRERSPCARERTGKNETKRRGSRASPDQANVPGQPGVSPPERNDGYADPFGTLGARSPFCRRTTIGAAASSCRISGSIEHPYPLSSYGIDVRVGFSLTKVENNLLGALQNVAALVWMGLVYLLKGVLLLLEWAFSLDLVGDAMPGAKRALQTLHERVLGQPWFLAAISIAGLWGIWHGLVQRKTIQTLGGLAATVLLMVAALVVIANPVGTVGYASRLANEGSLGLLSAASTGRVKEPERSFADSMRGLYDSLVLEPWCALEFGDVDWCLARAKRGSPLTNADVWLAFPAQSGQRESLYKLTKGEQLESGGILGSGISFGDLTDTVRKVATGGPLGQALGIGNLGREALRGEDAKLSGRVRELVRKDPERVRMQEGGGTFPRIALLLLIAAGMLGAVALLLYLGIKLLLAAILSLMLLLLAPAMLLAPAFGESGRATFVAWAKRLVGALAAKLVYALLLALVLVAASAIAALRIGWFGTWLLQLAFWWGVLLKRKELTGFVSAGRGAIRHGAGGARSAYRDAREAGFALGAARRGALRVGGTPVLALGRLGHERARDRSEGLHAAARGELHQRADEVLRSQLEGGRAAIERNEDLDRELRDTKRGLSKYDTLIQAHKEWGKEPPTPSDKEAALLRRRDVLEASKDTPEAIRQARSIVGAADRNLALKSDEFTDRDRSALVEQRRRDIESGLPLDHPRSLRFAGVDPRAYERASSQERDRMRESAKEALERDRRLLGAVPAKEKRPPRRGELQRARIELPPDRLRDSVQQRRDTRRQGQREQRRRERLYRPR
jgi:hypothetical protein